MKTRSRKAIVKPNEKNSIEYTALKTLDADVEIPPNVFLLPRHISSAARIISSPNCATLNAERYLVCPGNGFYEFTKVAGPKRAPRSWLLTSGSHQDSKQDGEPPSDQSIDLTEDNTPVDASQGSGYILCSPDLFVATPIDPLFILLPAMLGSSENIGQEFLAPSDYMVALVKAAPHLRTIIRPHAPSRLEQLLEKRLEAVCDCMDMGDDKMYALSLPKLARILVSKAKQTVEKGLPPSIEVGLIKKTLVIPDFGIKRNESSPSSAVTEDSTNTDENSTLSKLELQDSDLHRNSSTSNGSAITAATSASASYDQESHIASGDVVDLLRLRTVFDFLLVSYIAPRLHSKIRDLLYDTKCSGVDLSALDEYLAHIDTLKRQAQALRSLSDNISRKRSATEDEEATGTSDAKRRRKEEEENKKRSMSQGVKQLMKADTSGMKKLSAFFTKAPPKK